jgi:hypothetical protein
MNPRLAVVTLWAEDVTYVMFEDPSGNLIELVEKK